MKGYISTKIIDGYMLIDGPRLHCYRTEFHICDLSFNFHPYVHTLFKSISVKVLLKEAKKKTFFPHKAKQILLFTVGFIFKMLHLH